MVFSNASDMMTLIKLTGNINSHILFLDYTIIHFIVCKCMLYQHIFLITILALVP